MDSVSGVLSMSVALRNIDLMNLAGFCRNCFWAKVGTSSTERGFANVRFASFGLKAPREGYSFTSQDSTDFQPDLRDQMMFG